jgi:hypothetical protein
MKSFWKKKITPKERIYTQRLPQTSERLGNFFAWVHLRMIEFRYSSLLHLLEYIPEEGSSTGTKEEQVHYLQPNQFSELRIQHEMLYILLDLVNREQKLRVHLSKYETYEELMEKVRMTYQKMKKIQDEISVKKKQLEALTTKLKNPHLETDGGINWKDLVIQEEQLRLSAEIADRYRETETDASLIDWIEFTARHIQPRVLELNGLEVNEENLYNLRAAAHQTDVFWVKYNRARRGNLRSDDPVPLDVALYDPVSSQSSPLLSICRSNSSLRPFVFLAGSVS